VNHVRPLFDAEVRFENLIWLPGVMANEQVPNIFLEWIDWVNDREPSDQIFRELPELPAPSDDLLDLERARWILARRFGFLVKVAHPVRQYRDDTSWYSSWGYYSTRWLYADDIDGCVAAALAWALQLDRQWQALARSRAL
jgi:hypothetical protein